MVRHEQEVTPTQICPISWQSWPSHGCVQLLRLSSALRSNHSAAGRPRQSTSLSFAALQWEEEEEEEEAEAEAEAEEDSGQGRGGHQRAGARERAWP